MKLSLMAYASVVSLAVLTSGSAFAGDSKNISDGAAKGQASELTATAPAGGTACKPTASKPCPPAQPSMAVKGSGVPQNNTPTGHGPPT